MITAYRENIAGNGLGYWQENVLFFRLLPSSRLSLKIYRDDHSSLSGKCGVYAIAFMRMI